MNVNNILVTGGAGYIGSHIVELLVKTKSNVFIYDNLTTGKKKLINKKAKFIKGDIRNFKYLSKTIKKKIGAGGSIKNSELFFQGDNRKKIIAILESQGHIVKRVGG